MLFPSHFCCDGPCSAWCWDLTNITGFKGLFLVLFSLPLAWFHVIVQKQACLAGLPLFALELVQVERLPLELLIQLSFDVHRSEIVLLLFQSVSKPHIFL